MIAIGIVNEGYDTGKMPGWENGTVGYQTDGNIYDAENEDRGRPTIGQSLEYTVENACQQLMFK